MYKKVSTTLDFAGREKDTLAFWKQARIFEKSVELRRGAPAYTFYDGPPPPMASPISAISSPVPSRTSSPATAP